MNKKDIPKGVVCERCGKSAPIDEEHSNKNWKVYKTDKPCECGGRYILRVLYEMRKKKKGGEIGQCLFDEPPDDWSFENNEDNCACFEPKEQKIGINLKEIKQDAVTQLVNLVNKKLDYYDKHNIKLSAFYLSSMMKEALYELGYEN